MRKQIIASLITITVSAMKADLNMLLLKFDKLRKLLGFCNLYLFSSISLCKYGDENCFQDLIDVLNCYEECLEKNPIVYFPVQSANCKSNNPGWPKIKDKLNICIINTHKIPEEKYPEEKYPQKKYLEVKYPKEKFLKEKIFGKILSLVCSMFCLFVIL